VVSPTATVAVTATAATVPATVGHGVSALWYLTRASGLVSLILLTATVVLGIVASIGWTTTRWPRFLSQAVHRNLSLFCLALIGVHVVSTVGDGYVPIGLMDAVIPFRSPYRPIWVGLGALAFDMLLAVAITSALRRRIGVAAWRGVHWLAYACWPVAALHGLGSGSDPRLPGAVLVFVVCTAAVAAALAWRLASGRARTPARRVGGAVAGAAVLLIIAVFAVVGPLRPGWSHRAGTSPTLLAQLAHSQATSYASQAAVPPASSTSRGIPASPFRTPVTGTVSVSPPDASGQSVVDLAMKLADSTTPLHVRIVGPAEDGGVAMRSSQVTFGALQGQVTALEGPTITAVVSGSSGSLDLSMDLSLDPQAGTLTGQVSGSSGA
jgi:DMSO/TMAO reductase YedYZ heme-binding membrane subunit